jgi:RimJ/RimL family protein N-acetyltransferase
LALAFLYFAPRLGYKSCIFNLVFATNVASIRIWDKLGFERVGVVKGAGSLKGYAGLIDAYIYGYQFPETSITGSGGGGKE